ncbi:hypothetical protein CEUSTIGMA_g13921.t1 [Chlamydomonas eustigma]|uniref:DNA-3-methyladenine glycosylase II n=1 Tax=Chlamydomonas eustigma TaxID=1157962 RepID=A0A250XTZ2_9CHLO|nr:hypothetical protein CEUSTIGMA_g13921.t1 [Chlamydomonas eustigma]|eukprot:GAX86514.1 hypothetical protein CEUSTIGMA_g13921.t1 [Chlamydomonas eustigma]
MKPDDCQVSGIKRRRESTVSGERELHVSADQQLSAVSDGKDPVNNTLKEITSRSALKAAPELLGWTLLVNGVGGRIVEVEAYCGSDDPASHAAKGETARTVAMFGPPGHLYIYRSFGIHWCVNITCQPPGVGEGVLLRALEPTHGLDTMRQRRSRHAVDGNISKAVSDKMLCSGPGRLAQALGLNDSYYGRDLIEQPFQLIPPSGRVEYETTPRVGISQAVERPWRFVESGSPWVSPARFKKCSSLRTSI